MYQAPSSCNSITQMRLFLNTKDTIALKFQNLLRDTGTIINVKTSRRYDNAAERRKVSQFLLSGKLCFSSYTFVSGKVLHV